MKLKKLGQLEASTVSPFEVQSGDTVCVDCDDLFYADHGEYCNNCGADFCRDCFVSAMEDSDILFDEAGDCVCHHCEKDK